MESLLNRKNKLDEFLKINSISNSLRVSVKINKNGYIDTDRYTYNFDKLSNNTINDIISILTDNIEINEFISSRNNGSSFYLALDKESVRFYVNYPLEIDIISVYSIEVTQFGFKIRNYTPRIFKYSKIPECLKPFLEYLNKNIIVERDDSQNYLRFKNNINIPLEIFESINNDPKFINFVKSHGSIPLWIQFSESSFTFYFKIN